MVPMRVDYVYRSTGNQFVGPSPGPAAGQPGDDPDRAPVHRPAGDGDHQSRHLPDRHPRRPHRPGPDLRNHADPGWNGRLVYTFGGGCGGGHYRQGASTGGVLNDMMLTRGFAVASSSLNVLGNNCNDVTSGETMMMVKERFIEAFGVPRYTMGFGCSGAPSSST